MSDERRAPVQYDGRWIRPERHKVPGDVPGTIAWAEHEEAWRVYDKRYRAGQSAERIAERGGFGHGELKALLGHAPTTWRPL